MRVVSNSSALINLARIGKLSLLRELDGGQVSFGVKRGQDEA
jgi:hypothetical protein